MPALRSKSGLVVVLLVLVSAAAVLVGTQLKDEPRAGNGARLLTRADGSLAVDPPPLTLHDVTAAREGSASRAVLQLWYWAQWGSAANIVAAYAPAIVSHVGAGDIAGGYYVRRQSLIATRPRILGEVTTREGTTVTVEGLVRDARPLRYSFDLKRIGGRWYVVFDTLLEDAIAAYVQARNSPDPNSLTPKAEAVRAGQLASGDLRDFALRYQSRRAPSR